MSTCRPCKRTTKMNTSRSKGPLFDPGLCRCCGTLKKCRVLNIEYENHGKKETYSDMIFDAFGILLSHLDGKLTDRLVCATCVIRLRDACDFRRQVLQCEEAFLQARIYDYGEFNSVDDLSSHVFNPSVEVKKEPGHEVEGENSPEELRASLSDNGGYDSADDLPLAHHIAETKVPPNSSGDAQELPRVNKSPKDLRLLTVKTNKTKSRISNHLKPIRLTMSKLQQKMRERDQSYMMETNVLTIVEFSFVCPFKCRHNHLICYYCSRSYFDPSELRDHTETAHHPKRFKVTEHRKMLKLDMTRIDCRLCAAKIDTLEEFKTHISTEHNKKIYSNARDLILPFRLQKEQLKCALCDEQFPYFHALNKHMNMHFSNYVCATCGLGFVDKARFVMHQQRHQEGDFPCGTCGKVFKAEYNRDLHIDRVHNKRGRVYCPKCDVKLMSYPQKLKHLVEVHGEQPMSFPCDQCEKIFDARRMLTIHRRKEHLKDYRYECQYCGQKFFTRFALTNHMPTHTGERNFKCQVCEKSYPRLKTLKDHMRIHTNDRRYRCHICGQAFIQNCSLKGHMKSQHPEYG